MGVYVVVVAEVVLVCGPCTSTDEDAEAPVPADGLKRTMFGFERLRQPIQFTLDTCRRQLLLPRTVSVDEVFADAEAVLGDLGA